MRFSSDGDNRTTDTERTQLILQDAQQLDGAAEQIKARLSGLARLADGDNNQRSVRALRVPAGAYRRWPGKKGRAVCDIERLCLRLFPADVHKHDLLAKTRAGEGIGTMAADMSRAEDDDFLVFHGRFLRRSLEPIKKPLTSKTTGQGRSMCSRCHLDSDQSPSAGYHHIRDG